MLPHKARSRLASRPSFLLPAGIQGFGEARQQGELTSGSQKRGVQWEPQKVPRSQGYREMSPQATAPPDEAGLQGSPRIGAPHNSLRCGESGHRTACDQQSPSSLGLRPLGLVLLPHEHLVDEEEGIPCLDDSGLLSCLGLTCVSFPREAGEWGSCTILNKPNKEAPPQCAES